VEGEKGIMEEMMLEKDQTI